MIVLSSEEHRLLIRAELLCWLAFNFGAREWRGYLEEQGVLGEHAIVRWMLHDSEANHHRKVETWSRSNGFRSRYDSLIEENDPFWELAKELAAKRLEALPPHKGKASDVYGAMPMRYPDVKELSTKWIPHDGGKFIAAVKSQIILKGS